MGIFKNRVSNGKCGRCGKNDISPPDKQCVVCREAAREIQKEVRKARRANGMCVLCGTRPPRDGLTHCGICREKITDWNKEAGREYTRKSVKKSSNKLRHQVLAAYGGKCQCCGLAEPVWLTIDHIDGDGAKHRRELTGKNLGAGSQNIYRWLRNNNFPKGFQILCWCCNWAKSHGGCPHQHMRENQPEYVI